MNMFSQFTICLLTLCCFFTKQKCLAFKFILYRCMYCLFLFSFWVFVHVFTFLVSGYKRILSWFLLIFWWFHFLHLDLIDLEFCFDSLQGGKCDTCLFFGRGSSWDAWTTY